MKWIFLFLGAILLYFIYIYNKLVSLKAAIDAAWSDINVQLKRRLDLIPALVKTVQGYKDYEASTLKQIVEARNKALSAKSVHESIEANQKLSKALHSLFALAENYPELKANQNFLQLQEELSQIEETIANARRYYNAVVRDYNAKIESFPDIIIAKRFHFEPKEYFELEEQEQAQANKMPEIKFD